MQQARHYHRLLHVNALTLHLKFNITKAQALDILVSCRNCVTLLPAPSLGVNPKSLLPNHIWQMDVTHVSEFGKLRYVHFSVGTCSGIIFASGHTGEKSRDIIAHCLQAFAAWGKPG